MSKRAPLTQQPEKTARRTFPSIVMGWSRLARTGYAFIGAMALAMLLLPVVDQLFFSVGGVPIGQSSAPSLIIMILCLGLYFSGYSLMIGIPGNTPEDSRAQRTYIWLVLSITLLTIIWYAVQMLTANSGV